MVFAQRIRWVNFLVKLRMRWQKPRHCQAQATEPYRLPLATS